MRSARTGLMSEKMHRLMFVTNFNEHDTDLALPGATEVTQIVAVAATPPRDTHLRSHPLL
eukprot:2223508-Prymnesium_polylepis.1